MVQRRKVEGGRFAASFNIGHSYICQPNNFSKFKDELEDAKGRMAELVKENKVEVHAGRITLRAGPDGQVAEFFPEYGRGYRVIGRVVRNEDWFPRFWKSGVQTLGEKTAGVAYGVKGQDAGKVYVLRGREAHLAFFSRCDNPRNWLYVGVEEGLAQ